MLKVNQERLWESLREMGKIGGLLNGGCRRLALTDEDKAGRDLFVSWCRQSGCDVVFDQLGNIFARRPGTSPGLPAVATGSHLDTQPNGGKFDGVYGVLAGLEVIRSLNDAGIKTRAPIDVVVWTNEEGARFSPPLTGSSTFVGKFDTDTIHQTLTHDGALVRDELQRIGYLGKPGVGDRDLEAFFEAHIEQGPVLESKGLTIGVVTGIQGIRWYSIAVEGMDSHAGTTPMDMRKDALMGATLMVTQLHDMAIQSNPDIRFTVGRFDVTPNSGSTIAGKVNFNIDLRHPKDSVLDNFEAGMQRQLRAIAAAQQLRLRITATINAPPVIFDQIMVASIRQVVEDLGYGHMNMISGAGHDAMNLAQVVPTAMIFVPCKDGVSHNEAEFATPVDLAAGADVLLNVILARAQTI